MKQALRLWCFLLACVLLLSTVACSGGGGSDRPDASDAVVHADHTSVYEMIGDRVTVDMVREDADGMAHVTVDGVDYELGLDFLSMAMVYRALPAGDYATAEAAYDRWWQLFIQRCNALAPEIPLYSNRYYDLYNAKLENFRTSAYRSPADAIVGARVRAGERNAVILGSLTELSGAFRNAGWGKSSPGSADLDVEGLTTGHATVQTGEDGGYLWNMQALAAVPTAERRDDGTLTYTIRLRRDMVFSDGSPIDARHYIAALLASSTEVAAAAGGSGTAGLNLAGYDAFKAYNGQNGGTAVGGVTASPYFSGVKLLDDYTFSVTLAPAYADYYYAMSYASFTPTPLPLYLGDSTITVASDGACGLSAGFYETVEKNGTRVYRMVDIIRQNLAWDSPLPYSGPYTVRSYDPAARVATLTRNSHYPGDDARGTATIETVTYTRIVSETQLDQLRTGQVDVIAGITGGADTEAALALVAASPDRYAENHYDRAGYGFLGLRCDLGPTSDRAVRQAILYTINRPAFAHTFTGGYGSVVHGPYYEGFSSYKNLGDALKLDPYGYSPDTAVAVLEAGGWVYNGRGEAFDPARDTVRYKKITGYELSPQNLAYASIDGRYRTVKIDGACYMPLAINWYGTQPNPVTDLLITAWQQNPNATTAIGAYITYTSCDFTTGLNGEFFQMPEAGFDGVAKCSAINYATGFTGAAYDMAYSFTIDPERFPVYSRAYLLDEADYYENYHPQS